MASSYQQGCVEVIPLDDRLTMEEVEDVRQVVQHAMRHHLPQLVMDLRRVRLIDSAGLELLCEVHASCLLRGGMLRLAAASPLVCEILRITGLADELSLFPDVVSAAGVFAL